MSSNAHTFAGQLRHFARSSHIVDDKIFDRVRLLMYTYVRDELGVTYFEVMRDQDVEDEAGLKMFWSNREKDHSWRIFQSDDSPTNLITRAVAERRPLWVVSKDKSPLGVEEGQNLEDMWSHIPDIEQYNPTANEPIKTVIVLPLQRSKRQLGVCYLESSTYLGITEVAKSELEMLGEAIARLLELYEANDSQSRNTSYAIDELQDSLNAAKFPKLAKPHFFLAFSTRAEEDVTLVVKTVLHDLTDRLEFTDWSQMNNAGNIHVQIAKEIMRSTFGICFFSEPGPDYAVDAPSYVDNANVVFEAGMLHARAADGVLGGSREGGGWIPVRERNSPEAPFDLVAERAIIVPRYRDGGLDKDGLRQQLRSRIESLLGEP